MIFDPDGLPGYPRRVLKIALPPRKPSTPLGKFSHRDLARAALLSCLLREATWVGEPMLTRWASRRGLLLAQVLELLDELVHQGRVELATGQHATCLRWRAKGAGRG